MARLVQRGAASWTTEGPIFVREGTEFSYLQVVQTACRVHSAPYPTITMDSFPGA
jgi:hypothetical protein